MTGAVELMEESCWDMVEMVEVEVRVVERNVD
jgi:hypothetical protein